VKVKSNEVEQKKMKNYKVIWELKSHKILFARKSEIKASIDILRKLIFV
jgi:hypothetical protein